MDLNKREDDEIDMITRNVFQKNKLLGIYKRNWLEAFVLGFVGLWIVKQFHFVTDIEMVLSGMTFVFFFYLGIIGIKGRSITQIIIAEYRFQKRKRKLHLRSPEYVRKKSTEKRSEYQEQSIAEQIATTIKRRITEFIDTYSESETSDEIKKP